MVIERSRRRVSGARIKTLAHGLLDASALCAIATVSPRGRAHVNTAYFAASERLDVFWLSAADAAHSINVQARRSAAVAVYDSHQTWGNPDRGIQLFGRAVELNGRAVAEAERVYAARFPAYRASELGAYRFYRFRPRRLKLFDEPALGRGVFVTARVAGDDVAWERTEIYDPSA
jgi:uncharacterized protein